MFGSQMAKHDVLVFNSISLQSFDCVVWVESELDMIVQIRKIRRRLWKIFVSAGGIRIR